MTDIRTFSEITQADRDAVGGKGLSLGLMARAGLPVPPGFCISTAAYRRCRGHSLLTDAGLTAAIVGAYRDLGEGFVAVRSSATAEDGSAASFAGQQETVLGVQGDAAMLEAVERCWNSLQSDRAIAYRRQQGIDDEGLAMAVVVQRLVPAEVAGVLFTQDPLDPEGRRMLVEASWGLGESVVSGAVTPDRFHLDHASGAVQDRHISVKKLQINGNLQSAICNLQYSDVDPRKQVESCLDDTQLAELAKMGRKIEAFYGDARDVEWAWADGRFWVLQARPITAGGAAERALVRREEIAALQARAEPSGTVWSRFNLAEVLPEPTPMTWSVVRRFMSGRGGYGLMYRDLGFDPDASLDEEGVFDLVCGRPYCNLSREPRLYFRQLPFEHPFATLKAAPQRALYPQPIINPSRAGWRFWLALPILLPVLFWKMMRSEIRVRRLARTLAHRLRHDIFPAFAAETERAADEDLGRLDSAALLARLEYWVRRTLYDFARDSLKPTALAGVALKNLEKTLARALGAERTQAVLGELSLRVKPDAEADIAGAFRELAAGRINRQEFLARFGHRGRQEMELSQPRWSADSAALDRFIPTFSKEEGHTPATHALPCPETWNRIAAEAKLTDAQKTALETELGTLHTYLALRETAKHYLMKGYALIRRILLELDQRYRLSGGIFYLSLEELPELAGGKDFAERIRQRRRRRTLALSLHVPPVLFSDNLETIGRPVAVVGAATLQGVPLSAGVAEAPALVLTEPEGAEIPAEPYILVCPSTDPAWVPMFVNAKGLVMETGGVLSHGAIVAREFGLPAVAGLADVCRRLRSGQTLRVDGSTGQVTVLDEAAFKS